MDRFAAKSCSALLILSTNACAAGVAHAQTPASKIVTAHHAFHGVTGAEPRNGTAACLEDDGDDWAISYAWRQDNAPG